MLTLGLTPTEQDAYDRARLGPQRIRTGVQVWTLDHDVVSDLTPMYQSGQANDDTTADIQTSATVELFDPLFKAGFDDAADLGAVTPPKYMLHVTRGTYVDELGKWIDEPQFTGPVIRPTRDGDVLKLECQSKDSLAATNVWTPYVVKQGTNKVTAIKKIMADCTGEAFFNLATTTATISADISIGRDKNPWQVCKDIANGLGMVLFYDAHGVLQLRRPATAPCFVFSDGTGGTLTSTPSRGYGADGVTNAVRFTGGTPAGKKQPVVGTAVAPALHPYSPDNLGRHKADGTLVPRYLWTEVTSDAVKTTTLAKERAQASLDAALLDSVEVPFEALPISLENGDLLRVATSKLILDVRYRTGSRPFGIGTASYGVISRRSRTRRSGRF